MTRRILCVIPQVSGAVGGINVLFDYIRVLKVAGYDAAPVYADPTYHYSFGPGGCPGYFDPRLAEGRLRDMGKRRQATELVQKLRGAFRPKVNEPLELRSDDIIVVPEFNYTEVMPFFGEQTRVIVAQDVFGFMRAYGRDIAKHGGKVIQAADLVVTTSDAGTLAVQSAGITNVARTYLWLMRSGLNFVADKEPVIAIMPRKRPDDAFIVENVLGEFAKKAGYRIERLAGLSDEELTAGFRRARFFVALSKEEGFGLPPAEAMATGTIVVGYTGVGGNEYFTNATGYPIEDSDITALIATLRRLIAEYAEDPTQLDALRRHASDQILSRYTEDRAQKSVLAAFSQFLDKV